jgi:hypothetical protein
MRRWRVFLETINTGWRVVKEDECEVLNRRKQRERRKYLTQFDSLRFLSFLLLKKRIHGAI